MQMWTSLAKYASKHDVIMCMSIENVFFCSMQDNHLTPLTNACYLGLVDTARVFLRHLAKLEGDERVREEMCMCMSSTLLPLQ